MKEMKEMKETYTLWVVIMITELFLASPKLPTYFRSQSLCSALRPLRVH